MQREWQVLSFFASSQMAANLAATATGPWPGAGPRLRQPSLALGASLAVHALLLSLSFAGGQGLGLPGLSLPWEARRAEAPELSLVLQAPPAPPAPAGPAPVPTAAQAPASPPDPVPIATSAEPPTPTAVLTEPPATLPTTAPPVAPAPATVEPATPALSTERAQLSAPEGDAPQPLALTPLLSLARAEASPLRLPHPPAWTQLIQDAAQRAAQQEAQQAAQAQAREMAREMALKAAAAEQAATQARLEAARADAEAQRQALARQEAARVAAALAESQRQEAARLEAARQEALRQEAARQEAARLEAARLETARQDALRQEAARQESARAEAARRAERAAAEQAARAQAQAQAQAAAEAARRAEQEEDQRREERRRAIGRQLDEEAARRDAAARATPTAASGPALPDHYSSPRRARLFGRSDPNAELLRYAEALALKIQLNMTTFELVREAARQPHGDALVTVAVRSDGSIESISFVRSSGVPALDEAIRRVLHSQERYPPFPPALSRDYDVVEIRRTWHIDSAIRLY